MLRQLVPELVGEHLLDVVFGDERHVQLRRERLRDGRLAATWQPSDHYGKHDARVEPGPSANGTYDRDAPLCATIPGVEPSKIVPAFVLVLALGGCGGGSDSPKANETTPPPSAAPLAAAAPSLKPLAVYRSLAEVRDRLVGVIESCSPEGPNPPPLTQECALPGGRIASIRIADFSKADEREVLTTVMAAGLQDAVSKKAGQSLYVVGKTFSISLEDAVGDSTSDGQAIATRLGGTLIDMTLLAARAKPCAALPPAVGGQVCRN